MKNYILSGIMLLLLFGCASQEAGSGFPVPGSQQAENSTVRPSSGNPVVVLETSRGNIEIELYPEQAPVTADNFLMYVNEHFYDGTCFHRVMDGFMIQGGGFTPQGVERYARGPIVLESRNGLHNGIGYVAMARTGDPDSATSQFFINVADNAMLDYSGPDNPGYAVFGKVASGMDVVNTIKSVPVSNRGFYENWPVEDVVIIRAYVKQ